MTRKTRKSTKLVYGHGVNDLDCLVSSAQGKMFPFYNAWNGMLERCYSSRYHAIKPTYIGCTVCDEWKLLSNFKAWYDANHKQGYHLDKDILHRGNKVYSPSTCRYIPPSINSLLINCRSRRGEYPLGVSRSGSKFVAQCHNGDTRRVSVVIGRYDTPLEAFAAYKVYKEDRIKALARELMADGKIDADVFSALLVYEVSVQD